MRGKIKLVLIHTDKECGCRTFRQSLGGLEVGGLVLDECPHHKAETEAIHTRAMADYRARAEDAYDERLAAVDIGPVDRGLTG